ncbi:MAG: FMN-binding protein [Bacilli bacterium]|nr:FMN-binding protein [Bacilli bacterium]
MPKAVKYGLFLGVLGIIVGTLLGLVNFITKPIIKKTEEAKVVASLNSVNDQYTWKESEIQDVYRVGLDENNEIKMYVFKTTTKGYKSGDLEIMVFIADDKIEEIVILKMTDQTKGIGTKISDEEYLNSFKGRSVDEFYNKQSADYNNKNSIDVISGATYSSRGLLQALIYASNTYVNNVKGGNN